jgi:hypothetical protein
VFGAFSQTNGWPCNRETTPSDKPNTTEKEKEKFCKCIGIETFFKFLNCSTANFLWLSDFGSLDQESGYRDRGTVDLVDFFLLSDFLTQWEN